MSQLLAKIREKRLADELKTKADARKWAKQKTERRKKSDKMGPLLTP